MTAPDNDANQSALDLARQVQCMRAKIATFFPDNVFRDSVWDVMLELFVALREGRSVCVKELILVSGETSTTALRRIDRLERAGLLLRSHDPSDHRRVAVALTDEGDAGMWAMLMSLFATDASVATSASDGIGTPSSPNPESIILVDKPL